jgi:cation transport regulator
MTPYKTKEELPEPIKEHLPADTQDIYQEAFNNARRQFADPKKLNPRRGSSSFVVAPLRQMSE